MDCINRREYGEQGHIHPHFSSKRTNLGPLHTHAKSCDHDIVRAQKKVHEGRPKAPPKSCIVVTNPQV